MVVGVGWDQSGRPVCSQLWPGNTAEVKSLVPVVERRKSRFRIGTVCIVADRGMISAGTLAEIEQREWNCIVGVRMRSSTEAKAVVGRAGRYAEVHPPKRRPRRSLSAEGKAGMGGRAAALRGLRERGPGGQGSLGS